MAHSLADFYRGKRVLITGHTGFQGGWAVAWLKVLGAQVCGYGLPPASRPNFFDATLLDHGMTSIFSDVRDRNSLANLFTEFQPEIVLHCASRSNQQFAQREPVEAFSTNVMGTVNVLEEARLTASVRAVVLASSAACKQSSGSLSAYEEHPPRIRDASMACAELARSAFGENFFRNKRAAVGTARASDAIGGGDWGEGRIVPNLVRGLTSGEPVHIDAGSEMPVWHVLDLVHAYLLLARKLFELGQEYSGEWDITPKIDCRIRVNDLAKNFVKFWDGEGEITQEIFRENSLPSNEADDRAYTQLGWTQILPIDSLLHWTVEWYRAFYTDPSSVWRTTDEQIDRYMKSALVSAEAQTSLRT